MDHGRCFGGVLVVAVLSMIAGPVFAQPREEIPTMPRPVGGPVPSASGDLVTGQLPPPGAGDIVTGPVEVSPGVVMGPAGMLPGPEVPPPHPPFPPSGPIPPVSPAWVPLPPKPGKHHLFNGSWAKGIRQRCCWSCINCYGCNSLGSECDFVFGSCRTFFGDPCLKAPPPLLVPAGYTPPRGAAGYGTAGGPGGGCSRCGQAAYPGPAPYAPEMAPAP